MAGLACGSAVHAQFVGTLGLDSAYRYRGTGTSDAGPVLRASLMADSTSDLTRGAYAGLAGLWRTHDAGLANAEAMLGWSGRLNAMRGLEQLDADWGWDVGVHRMHYGEGSRYDFTEAMVGVLAPGWAVRAWWTPHYFGGSVSTLYTELNGSRDLGDGWRAFAHVGALRYGDAGPSRSPIPGRTDGLVGVGYVAGAWDFRFTRDGLLTGYPPGGLDDRRSRGAAWVLGSSVAF
jgi:hypothetical protein